MSKFETKAFVITAIGFPVAEFCMTQDIPVHLLRLEYSRLYVFWRFLPEVMLITRILRI